MRWITALNLQEWANSLAARTIFPGMIADLIRATAQDIGSIRFPNGEKGQVRGFDGELNATGVPPYVPNDTSIWEFGVSEDAITKANKDYRKRTNEIDESKRKNTTFVFVSPRTWDNPKEKLADWIEAKKALNEWKEVIYLDGSMIEDWLAKCPAVAARYARYELGLFPKTDIRSTDEFWAEYSTRFEPALVEQVLLAGRESQASTLLQRLSDGAGKLSYAADSPDEVIAFAVAAIRCADPAVRLFLEAKTLIIDTEEAARQMSAMTGQVFFPRRQARNLVGLLVQKGPTVVSAGADEKKNGHEVLNRPTHKNLAKAFTGMNFTEQDGYDIARQCGRSLAVLARQRPSGTAEKPEWLEHDETLLPALLAGAWHEQNPYDQEIIFSLATAKNYTEYEAPLRRLAKLQDPPIEHVGDIWTMRASVDAFVHLGHLIGSEHLERFAQAAKIVFSKIAEPPKAEEVYKPTYARTSDAHSQWLRDGMMNTLLHMAVLHEQAEFTVAGMTPQEYVNGIVRSLPGLTSDYRLLASLQDQLALLAEAAPIPFLDALERLLEGDVANIRPIFEEHKTLISSRSYHYGVLWALEVIAWDPQLLLRASLCLAHLAKIDPGGSDSNRPINSLQSIFLPWSPNTSATTKQRKGVLTYILREVPSIAWQLLTKLLPKANDISSPTQQPTFREFGEQEAEILTYSLVWENQSFVITLAIHYAGLDPERWVTLIEDISNFPKEGFEVAVKALETTLSNTEANARFVIWDALQKEVNKHRAFAKTDWALSNDEIAPLESLIKDFAPKGAIERAKWLFDDWMPNVQGKMEDDSDTIEIINSARKTALQQVMMESGSYGLIALAQMVKIPQEIATIASLEMSFEELTEFFDQALHTEPRLDTIVGQILKNGALHFEDRWMSRTKSILLVQNTEPKRIAGLLTSLDETIATWNFVKEFGDDVHDAYWQSKHAYSVRGSIDELLIATHNYLAYGRPLAALAAASHRINDLPASLLLNLLDEAVQEINILKGVAVTMHNINIERAFEALSKKEGISLEAIASLEFRYLPIFLTRKKPLILHTLLIEQPKFYIDAICMAFKSASGQPEMLPEGAEKLASAAYKLLASLRTLPGQEENKIDEDKLLAWCTEVRQTAKKVDRVRITDQKIGSLLAHAPSSPRDNAWPHESVRSIIEQLASEEVERGVVIERFNMRGVYSKAIGEGGEQERTLSQQYRGWAEMVPDLPRTAALLMHISEGWFQKGQQADISAAKQSHRM